VSYAHKVAEQSSDDAALDGRETLLQNAKVRPEIFFATSADGTRIAWSRHGRGPVLVRVGTWLTNLEHDWESPVWKHWLTTLGERFTVVRYDDRGSGLSDRSPADISFGAWLADLEAVINAAGLDHFSLFGMSQAGSIAVAYAQAHPERVDNVIVLGAYSRGVLARDPTPKVRDETELAWQMIKVGWGRADPVYRRVFTTSFIPGATEEQMRSFDELQRRSMTPDMALASSRARSTVDVTAAALTLTVPTLVLHADGDMAVPFEEGRLLAGQIPGARFVPLHGRNHILLADEPAWSEFIDELTAFVGEVAPTDRPRTTAPLTTRELDVLRLVADGCSNDEIATRLSVSTRTIERHLSNIYVKLTLSGKSARAGAAARLPELDQPRALG
jgi:pimeloyl-ACP methyl ester carboxylesterase/DNA-binding CsgD family transcriptional regulator